ncbi:MAG TPA: WYL domain-containing protein [Fibrobacteria bacterium]|nr:WYL domain-containing protein [Fibrobacteria bacterium]
MGRQSEKARSGRLDELTGLLRSRETWTTTRLAEALGVSHRTLMRDLELLREKGVPVEGERGRGGGVRLHWSWGAGRLTLDYRETLDLLLSLAVVEKMKSSLLLGAVTSIRKKIALSFPDSERKRILSLRNRIWIGEEASARVRSSYGQPDRKSLDAIHASFFDLKKLAIQYVDEKEVRSSRLIEPHFLFLNWPIWYLLAWDELRGGVRFFRVDRIKMAKILPDTFRLRDEKPFLEVVASLGNSL